MSVLFGDLSPAPLSGGFLEDLRDAFDFATRIAEADQIVATADARRGELQLRAEEEIGRVTELAEAMLAPARAVVETGGSDGVTAGLAADLSSIIASRRNAAEAVIEEKLAQDIRALDAGVIEAREDYFPILEVYLLSRAMPGGKETISVELHVGSKKDSHRYVATSVGEADVGLGWTIEIGLPEGGDWSGPLRVARVAEGTSVLAPHLSGLIKKDVKRKKQRLDHHVVTYVADDGADIRIELRADVGDAEGFLLVADPDRRTLSLAKTGDEGDPTVGVFDIADEDEAPLIALASKLRAMVRALPRKRLATATFDGLPFDGTNADVQPTLVGLVSRIVDKLAPIVIEVEARSRSVEELVLRRILEDGRREELFLPKARLRERLLPLDDAHRELFAAVATVLAPARAAARVEAGSAPEIRAEIPLSIPPLVRRKSGQIGAVVVPPAKPAERDARGPKNAGLAATLERIRPMAENGQLGEALREYALLFATSEFKAHDPEDRRHALRRMMFGKLPSSPTEEMQAAHRAALPCLQVLVLEHHEPADYEMLGMAYIALDEPEKATEMFKKALDIERARDPVSDLCRSLMRRAGAQ